MEIKSLDQRGIDFLVEREALRLEPYLDVTRVSTISAGVTVYEDGTRVKMTDPSISHQRAVELFLNTVKSREQTVWALTRDDINQNQFNALVSLVYNIGSGGFKTSTVLKKVNDNPNDPTIKDAFLMWSKARVDGKLVVVNGLKNRRLAEVALYFS